MNQYCSLYLGFFLDFKRAKGLECSLKVFNLNILSKAYAADLRKKMTLFKHYSKTKKQVFLTFISTYGVLENEHSLGVVDRKLGLGELFEGNAE
jgi:uncharacterized protein